MKKTLALAGLLASSIPASTALATVTLYSESFSGGATSINGVAPTSASSLYGASSTATWSAYNGFLQNGFVVNAEDSSALLPFAPVADQVYTLTVTMLVNTTAADNDWLGFGFNAVGTVALPGTAAVTNAGRFTDTGQLGKVWAIAREAATNNSPFDQDVQLFGSGTTNPTTTTETDVSFDGTVVHTFSLILDTTGGNLSTNLLIDGTTITNGLQPVVGVLLADIHGVGLTHNNTTNAGVYFDSFSLTAVPEPSTFAALAGLVGLGFAASRRRRA